MRRGYSAERFMDLIGRVRTKLPNHSLSTDVIVGYPGETDDDFEATLELMRQVQFDSACMFIYSEREGTLAARKKPDDIPIEVKKSRLKRLIELQEGISKVRYQAQIGRDVRVLCRDRLEETRLSSSVERATSKRRFCQVMRGSLEILLTLRSLGLRATLCLGKSLEC